MSQHNTFAYEGQPANVSWQTQNPSEAFHNDIASATESMYHGEALGRLPFLERTGGWISLGFTGAFAIFLLLMNAAGQVPGQSFALKSISDFLQFAGEGIGLFFSIAITLRLRKVANTLTRQLRQMETQAGRTRSELMALRTEVQDARRSYLAWVLLSIAIAVYAAGQAAWTSFDVRMPSAEVPYPGLYDIGFVSAYPFFVIGALLLTRRSNRAATVGRVRVLLDAFLVIGAALALSWFFVLSPSISGLAQQPSTGAAFLSLYFPGGDLLLVALGAFLMFSQFSTREQQPVFFRLCVGLFLLAVTDSLLVWFTLTVGFNTGTIQDILWPLSMQLVGLAAIAYPQSIARAQQHAARARGDLGETSLASRLSVLSLSVQTAAPFVLALATSAILLTVVPVTNAPQRLAASLVALALFLLVAARQALTLNENNRLRLQLAGELVLSRRELQVTRRAADMATQEAQEKQRLEEGVVALQAVHARIANGDFSVRASTEPGPLQGVAVSVNLMVERLKDLALRATRYEQMSNEARALQEALDHLSQGMAAWSPTADPRNSSQLRSLFLGVERVQRFQLSQWKNLLSALERVAAPLTRLQTARDNAGEVQGPQSNNQDIPAVSHYTLQQVERQLRKLIEQTQQVIARMENKSRPQAPISSAQFPPHQRSLPPQGPEMRKTGRTSQQLHSHDDLASEGLQKNAQQHQFPRKTPLFPE